MCPKVSCTLKDLPYEAILRDRQHHSWPSIPLSLTWVFRRDTPLKLAIRGGHIKRDRHPAGCPSVSVQSTHVVKFLVSFSFTSKLLLEKRRFDYNRNISFPLKHRPTWTLPSNIPSETFSEWTGHLSPVTSCGYLDWRLKCPPIFLVKTSMQYGFFPAWPAG